MSYDKINKQRNSYYPKNNLQNVKPFKAIFFIIIIILDLTNFQFKQFLFLFFYLLYKKKKICIKFYLSKINYILTTIILGENQKGLLLNQKFFCFFFFELN